MCAGLILALLGGYAPAALADPVTALSTTTKAEVDELLASLQEKSSSSDVRYLESNVWVDGSPTCFRCTLGPSVLAAARGRDELIDDRLVKLSIATLNVAIRDHQRPDGSYVPPAPGEGGPGIQTMMFANELAWTYLILGPRLDFSQRTKWANSLIKSADWLVREGASRYYVNGNINLAITMNLDLTYRITGLSRFKQAAADSLAFTLSPPQDRFPGFGLKYTKVPTQSDGSDGSAYLAERGSGKPGYDPAYGLFQVDMATMWFSVTGDPTAKRLANLLVNQLLPRVRTSDWTIDVSGGTRRAAPGVRYAFGVSAISVLALKGGRQDLEPLVRPQVLATLADYKNATRYPSPGVSYNYGIELAAIYMAVTSTLFW